MAELKELVKVSTLVKSKLDELKTVGQHSSYDSLIRELIRDSEENEQLKRKIDELEEECKIQNTAAGDMARQLSRKNEF